MSDDKRTTTTGAPVRRRPRRRPEAVAIKTVMCPSCDGPINPFTGECRCSD